MSEHVLTINTTSETREEGNDLCRIVRRYTTHSWSCTCGEHSVGFDNEEDMMGSVDTHLSVALA